MTFRACCLLMTLVLACGDDEGVDGGVLDGGPDRDASGDGGDPGDGSVSDGVPATDAGPAGSDAGPYDAFAPSVDAGPLPDFPGTWPQSRGWDWVRDNDPFITALSVRMGDGAPAADVTRYFDEFHANAVHLWETGTPTAIDSWLAARPGASWLVWVNSVGNSPVNNMFLGGRARPPGLIGYQIGDEPRTQEHLEEILGTFDRVATADPQPLRVLNFTFEAEEIDSYLAESCANGNVDVFSYDHYSLGNGQFSTMMKFRNAAIACGIPFWRYLKGYVSESDDGPQAESDLRWDAMGGLLAGYTGHTWFLYNVRGGVMEGIPTTFFEETETWGAAVTPRFGMAAQINRELLVYGRAQTRLRSTGVAWYTPNELAGLHPPDDFPAWREGADPFLTSVATVGNDNPAFGPHQDALFGFYEDRFGDHYVMVMNPNHAGGRFPTNSDTRAQVTLGFDFSSDASVEQDHLLVLRANGVIESARVQDGTAVFDLAAGELAFFKYDTGRGFEGYR